ncbi:hypothetical protein CK203_102063 [Vitis vinifera]|uniref:Uncharacterized protein n=1 Tax=Vitis vinifera TaxID=29760 RepID=A0A438CHE6_VITVI|nr:hypothetical protein CK203_102063 [Vitis vinifera]
MRLRVKNLMQERNNEDLYNPIDLNHIFNDDDILDEWIREGEEPILSSDNLDWLDKGLPTNEEGRERDVDSRRKGKASRTISSSFSSDDGDNRGSSGWWHSGGNRGVGGTSEGIGGDGNTGGGYVSQVDPGMSRAQGGENYYATQDTDHGYRPRIWEQQKHLERLTTFPKDDDYSSGHDYHRSNYHRIDEHLQNLGIGSRPYFRGVDDRSYHNFRDRDSSSSTFSRNDFDRFPMMHPEGYSNIGTRASDSYGYDQSSSSSSIAYRDFGYYQYGVDPEQPLKPYFPDYGSSSQSSHPTYSSYEQLFNHILTMGIATPICILVVGLMMMILNPFVIQHGIDYCIEEDEAIVGHMVFYDDWFWKRKVVAVMEVLSLEKEKALMVAWNGGQVRMIDIGFREGRLMACVLRWSWAIGKWVKAKRMGDLMNEELASDNYIRLWVVWVSNNRCI